MDVSDPQTLGFVVFGGFMFISAVGIALVSKLSMKETSYEEALAQQRLQLVQAQLAQRAEKKKKDRAPEKKSKAKKKELSQLGSDAGEELEVVTSPEPEPEPEPVMEVLITAMVPVLDVSPANSVTEVTEEPKVTARKKKSKTKLHPVTNSSLLLPYDALQKHLEEKEKLLTTEQADLANAKSRLRELSKELGAEKNKMASLDARLKVELSVQVQKVNSIRVTMETTDEEHRKHTQQLNQKIGSLQEQLENGSNAQLARLQQENSILRDALNQATSQAESRQNAELARLRKDCIRLGRELTERTDALRVDEERRKSLEAKMASYERKMSQSQLVRDDAERALKRQLDELRLKLKTSLQEAAAVSELKKALESRDVELQGLKVQLENQVDVSPEVDQLKICGSGEEVEAAVGDERKKDGSESETESDQPFESLEEDSQLLRLEEELQQLHETHIELKNKMAALSTSELQNEQREAELKAALASIIYKIFKLEWSEAELRDLQQRSKQEKNTWKKKLSEAELQKQTVLDQLKLLQDNVQLQRTDTEDTQQLKVKMMLLEAQLEKQLEEANLTQSCSKELAEVQSQLQAEQEQRQQLERQLEQAQKEAMELRQQVEADLRPATTPQVESPIYIHTYIAIGKMGGATHIQVLRPFSARCGLENWNSCQAATEGLTAS
ncbi:ribosome-binding protein 1b isoform 3-T3 [Spinachia spinachia]